MRSKRAAQGACLACCFNRCGRVIRHDPHCHASIATPRMMNETEGGSAGGDAETMLWVPKPRVLTWRAFTDSSPELTPSLNEIMEHIVALESRMARVEAQLQHSLHDVAYGAALRLFHCLPGIDLMGVAMLLVEIGADMSVCGSTTHWPRGWAYALATTSQRVSARADDATRATLGRAACCALKAVFQALNVRKGHKRSSWHWGTTCCARCTQRSLNIPTA